MTLTVKLFLLLSVLEVTTAEGLYHGQILIAANPNGQNKATAQNNQLEKVT